MECPMKKIKLESGESDTFASKIQIEEPPAKRPEELRQFHVLDEVTDDVSGSENEDGNGEEWSGSEVGDDEIEAMLEEGLPENFRGKKADGENRYEEKFKTVLEELSHNHFEVLPEGWVQVTHNSGMPLYLHKSSRVCCLSMPYFLGPGSARKHEIPLAAVPCLSYRKSLEKGSEVTQVHVNGATSNDTAPINQNTLSNNSNDENVKNSNVNGISPTNSNQTILNNLTLPNAKIETAQENLKNQSLTAEQLRQYCANLFKFKTIKVMRFKSWSARRKFTKSRRHIRALQRPTLPDGTKLITFPVINNDTEERGQSQNKSRKEWIMNPNGKSYVCILHEYLQHALKKQPSYEFKELENAATPYAATVTISDMKYGVGYGTSKKQAKSDAARATLEILIPEMREKISADAKSSGSASRAPDQDLSFFDEIKVEDPRVAEFCAKTTEPLPHAILLTCIQRNYGLGNIKINYEVNTLKHQKNEFSMTVGKHTATVACKNKRDGKQRASQAILQSLHPHITSWGSLLRLYGSRSVKSFKEKKQEEQEITLLQSKAAINQPNFAILNKLKLEMSKLDDQQSAIVSIGTFVAPDNINMPSSSGSNLNNVDL